VPRSPKHLRKYLAEYREKHGHSKYKSRCPNGYRPSRVKNSAGRVVRVDCVYQQSKMGSRRGVKVFTSSPPRRKLSKKQARAFAEARMKRSKVPEVKVEVEVPVQATRRSTRTRK
jgi:hypothetical protein